MKINCTVSPERLSDGAPDGVQFMTMWVISLTRRVLGMVVWTVRAEMAAVAGLYGLGDDQRARHRRGQANAAAAAERSESRDDNTEA